MIKAVAYYRTSSAANVRKAEDKAKEFKDSEERQRQAVLSCAAREGYQIVKEFNDPAVSGADPIDVRPGFAALLDRIESNGVKTVIVEDASRFARDLMTQELGIMLLIQRGVKVITGNGEDLTVTDDPMKKAMRQMAGVFAELEKARLVGKLRAARMRKRALGFKVEGRKSYNETNDRLVDRAKELRAKTNSFAKIAEILYREGHANAKAHPLTAMTVKRIIER